MSATGFLADVALARRQIAEYEAIHAKHHPEDKPIRWLKWFFLWAVPPLAALVPYGIGVVLASLYLFVYLMHMPPLELSTFEALRAPSRRALYAARLGRSVPWLLWLGVGAVLSAAWALPLDQRPWKSAALLALLGLLPLFSLGLGGLVGMLLRLRAWGALSLLASYLFPVWMTQWETENDLLGEGPALLALPAALAVLTAGLLALQVWVLGRLEPLRQITLASDQSEKAASAGTAWYRSAPVLVGPSPLVRGHGLGSATRYRAFALVRYNLLGTTAARWGPGLLFLSVLSIFRPLIIDSKEFFSDLSWTSPLLCVSLFAGHSSPLKSRGGCTCSASTTARSCSTACASSGRPQ
jgi:hypothetical protein